MDPKTSLVCLINGHIPKPRLSIGMFTSKETPYPVCTGCNRRIKWFHLQQRYVLTNPYKK